MEPNNQNQYDFILSPQQPKKSGMPNVQSKGKRLVIFIGLMLLVVSAIIVGYSFISSIGKVNSENIITIRAHQTELDRILEDAIKNVSDVSQKNRLTTLQVSLTSDSAKLSKLLTDRKVTITPLQLAAKEDTEATDALENARKNGNYDAAVLALIEKVSNEYYKALKVSIDNPTSDKEKEIVSTAAKNLELIAAQN